MKERREDKGRELKRSCRSSRRQLVSLCSLVSELSGVGRGRGASERVGGDHIRWDPRWDWLDCLLGFLDDYSLPAEAANRNGTARHSYSPLTLASLNIAIRARNCGSSARTGASGWAIGEHDRRGFRQRRRGDWVRRRTTRESCGTDGGNGLAQRSNEDGAETATSTAVRKRRIRRGRCRWTEQCVLLRLFAF